MATLFLYDENIRGFTAASPALLGGGRGQDIMWSHRALIQACREVCARFEGLALRPSFRRVGRGGFAPCSPHYAGLAADFALLSPGPRPAARQGEIRRWCVRSGLFAYVQPQYRTPLWIHAEVGVAPPCCLSIPYPILRPGDMGPHVYLLQDCLNANGCPCLLSGRFGGDTLAALLRFKAGAGLGTSDCVDAGCWRGLFRLG